MKSTYDDLIKAATKKHLPDYDWRLLKAQLCAESNLDPKAVSPVGATGIAQFMLPTWEQWAPMAGYPFSSRNNPEASIFTAAAYMKHLIDGWFWPRPVLDRYELAMASYNAGMKNILDAQEVSGGKSLYHEIIEGLPDITGPKAVETTDYVTRILEYYEEQLEGDEPNE